jgi:hypothetical protein
LFSTIRRLIELAPGFGARRGLRLTQLGAIN